jgi:hypothetical protein
LVSSGASFLCAILVFGRRATTDYLILEEVPINPIVANGPMFHKGSFVQRDKELLLLFQTQLNDTTGCCFKPQMDLFC